MGLSVNTYTSTFNIKIISVQKSSYTLLDSDGISPLEQLFKESVSDITVNRSLGDVGNFSITLYPRPITTQSIVGTNLGTLAGYSWETQINPMDYIQISLSDPTTPNNTIVVMRGFVSDIRRRLDISSGTPQEVIMINGTDWGKIMQFPIYYLILNSAKVNIFNVLVLQTWYNTIKNMQAITLQPSQLLSLMYNNNGTTNAAGFNGFFGAMATSVLSVLLAGGQFTTPIPSQIPQFNFVDAQSDTLETNKVLQAINPVAQPMCTDVGPNTTIIDMFRAFQAAPWRELYFDDFPNGTQLIYKPTPWRDLFGNFVQQDASIPENTTAGIPPLIGPKDYTNYDLGRSDGNVYNGFFTYMQFDEPIVLLSKSTGGFVNLNNQNPTIIGGNASSDAVTPSDWRLFGVRFREEKLQYIDFSGNGKTNQENAALLQSNSTAKTTANANSATLNNLLQQAMNHNELLTEGSITTFGDANKHIGRYIRFQKNDADTPSYFYVEGVSHYFRQPANYTDGAYLTTLSVTRGEDYLNQVYR